MVSLSAIRGSFLHFLGDPSFDGEDSYEYIVDGLLVLEQGKVVSLEKYTKQCAQAFEEIIDYRGTLIVPGFVDTHIHYSQTEMLGAYGEQLLEWLEVYTFPTEKKFEDKNYAKCMAKIFLDELIKNGTTTALVFATVHKGSVDAFFEEAKKRGMRMIAGKVMMDRNAPNYLLDTPQSSFDDSEDLIKKWHGKGRLSYAITPRFAPTSTRAQLEKAQKLKELYPEAYIHTHLAENLSEIEWVKRLFPERSGYLDVYDHYGLTGDRSVFAHCVHLSDEELNLMGVKNSSIAFCPTSNFFLGSGLFDLKRAKKANIRVGLGTDIGAGTSFSQLMTLNEAYKVQQLQSNSLSALEGFYLATLGGAKSLSLDDKIGNFEKGKEADFVILNYAATPLQELRMKNSRSFEDKLFALMMMGDDRNIVATYVAGKCVYE